MTSPSRVLFRFAIIVMHLTSNSRDIWRGGDGILRMHRILHHRLAVLFSATADFDSLDDDLVADSCPSSAHAK